jgi:NADPH:quinone reductase-like Zn-dependent oxidoreductase
MLAVYAKGPEFADPLSALVIGERPEPVVPDGWVRVRISAASLNRHDLWTLRGVGVHPLKFPTILGCDGAGTLDDGSEIVLYPVITSTNWCSNETLDPGYSVFSEIHQGTLADYVVAPRRNVLPRPESLSPVSAAALGTAWLTAYRMLFSKSGLQPGMTMLIQGASGGVATALIQLGRAAGMEVWVTGRTDKKRAVAEQLGAHRTFAPGEALPNRVDAVFESVGEATWAHSLESVRRGGTIVVVGMTSGNNPPANILRIFVEQIAIVGSAMGTLHDMRNLIHFVVTSGIVPKIGLTLPLREATEGFRAMWEDRTSGKVVFTR